MVVGDVVDGNVAWLSLTWTVTWRGCREVVVGDVVDGDVIVVDVVVGNVVYCYYNVAWLSMTLSRCQGPLKYGVTARVGDGDSWTVVDNVGL